MNLFDQKREITNFYQDMIDDPNHLFSEYYNELLQQKKLLEEEKFSIVVAGRFSAGKSLLINRAFLREDILPYKNEPVTCHPVHILYGDKCQLILRDNEGGIEVIAEGNSPQDDKFTNIKNALQRHGAHYGDDPDRYQHVELQWHDSEIFKNGIAMVDTIGTEDIDDRYIQQTFAEMEKGSAVIFLFNMKMAGTQTEQNFLEKYLGDTGKKLFIVLNRADVLESDEDRNMVLTDFKQRFKPFFAARNIRVDDRIFMVSAKTGQGLDELRHRLVDFIANDRVKELLIQHTAWLKNGLSSAVAQIKTYLQDLENKFKGDEQALLEAHKKIENLEQNLSHREDEIEIMKMDLIEQAEYHLDDEIETIRQRVIGAIRNIDRDEALEIITDVLERMVRVSERVGIKLQKEVRNSLDSRMRKWTGHMDLLELESRFTGLRIIDGTIIAADNIGLLGGGASLFWGVSQAFSVYTTAATTAANAGWFSQISTVFLGGGGAVSAPLLASVTIAAPWIAGGILIAGISHVICKHLKEKQKLNLQEEVRTALREILRNSKKEMTAQINNYVNEQVDNYLTRLTNEIHRQKQQLKSVIKERDIQVLRQNINVSKPKLTQLNNYLNRLSKLIPKQ